MFENYLKGKKYLIFFGRYNIHKGAMVLAQALPEVLKKLPDCHAVFVGKDSMHSSGISMRLYISELCRKYSDRLFFFDQQRHETLYPLIAESYLVVLPSIVDNLPNALLEAMALGKPVIGTKGASFEEVIIDGKNGFLVPIGDPNALADVIIHAWNNPNIQNIGIEAAKTMQRFSPENTINALLAYFDKIGKK